MKISKTIAATALSALALSISAFAATNINPVSAKQAVFSPVKWRITTEWGGLAIPNNTTKNQIVQISLEEGSGTVSVFTLDKNQNVDCIHHLDGSYATSAICEIAPGEKLQIDKNFADEIDAVGIYQIAFQD